MNPLPTSSPELPRQLPRLTSLRIFAALMVFGFHVTRIYEWAPGSQSARYGLAGVAFFFIISGFVLTWSAGQREIRSRQFWWRRFARVYPAHLAMSLIVLALRPFGIGYPESGSWVGDTLAIILLQAWFPDNAIAFALNAVSWSLSVEAFFYLLAPQLIRWLRRLSTSLVALVSLTWWLLCVLIAEVLNRLDFMVWAYTLPPVRSGEFVLGIGLAVLIRRHWQPLRILKWAVIPATLLVLTSYAAMLRGPSMTQYGAGAWMTPAFVLLIAAAAMADIDGLRGPLKSRFLVHLGTTSYCFYLVHEVFLFSVAPLLPEGIHGKTSLGVLIALIAGAQLLAEVLYRLVERPAQRFLTTRGPR